MAASSSEQSSLRFPRTVRGLLVVLLLVALVPVVVLQVSVYIERHQNRQEAELQGHQELARAVAMAFSSYLQAIHRQELAVGVALATGRLSMNEIERLMRVSVGAYEAVSSLAWVSPTGRLLYSTAPGATGIDISDRPYFQRLLAGERWVVSDLLRSRLDGRPAFAVATAIRDQMGAIQGAVLAIVDANGLREALDIPRPEEGSIVVIDSQGRGVYRYPEVNLTWKERNWIDKVPMIRQALATNKPASGIFDSAVTGEEHMGALVPIEGIGWLAGATRPLKHAMQPITRNLIRNILLLLSVSLLAFLVALLLGRYLRLPLAELRHAMGRFGRGELGRRAVARGPKEVVELAHRFNEMAGELQARNEEMVQANRRLQTVLDVLPVGLFIVGPQGQFTHGNESALRIWGGDAEVPMAGNVSDYEQFKGWTRSGERIGPEQWPVIRALHLGQTVLDEVIDIERFDGTCGTIVNSAAPLLDADGQPVGAVALMQDITERVRAELERERLLKEVERRVAELDATFDAIADGLVLHDAEGRILRMNELAQRVFRFPPGSHRQSFEDRVAGLRAEAADGKKILPQQMPSYQALTGETIRGTIIKLSRPDRDHWLSMSAAPICTPDGTLIGAVTTFTDVTRLHELQEQRDIYLQTISHDLRSPLSVVQGNAIIIQRLAAAVDCIPTQVARSAEAILRGARQMNVMIQDLVDAARQEGGQLQLQLAPLSLHSFLQDLLGRHAATIEVERLRTDLAPDLPLVLADSDRLERILLNLLSNALKYSPAETVVRIVGRLVPEDSSEAPHEQVAVSIVDQGPGIPKEDQQRLFERFYRVRNQHRTQGVGLGLYISRMLVEAHGGRLWVESEPGQGSAFRFLLPVARDEE